MVGDIIDKAEAAIEAHHKAALSKRAPSGPKYTGWCHFCSTPLDPPERWCDAGCRDDWEAEQRAARNKEG